MPVRGLNGYKKSLESFERKVGSPKQLHDLVVHFIRYWAGRTGLLVLLLILMAGDCTVQIQPLEPPAKRVSGTHPLLKDGRSGQERQVDFAPTSGTSWISSTRESDSAHHSSRKCGNGG